MERTLSDEQKALLTRLTDSMSELDGLLEFEMFAYAYKLGARMTAESLYQEKSP